MARARVAPRATDRGSGFLSRVLVLGEARLYPHDRRRGSHQEFTHRKQFGSLPALARGARITLAQPGSIQLRDNPRNPDWILWAPARPKEEIGPHRQGILRLSPVCRIFAGAHSDLAFWCSGGYLPLGFNG